MKAKAAKSDWLQDLFLHSIMLFTDKRYFSDSEWDCLEHLAPPYGFMELNYSCESFRTCQDGTIKLPTGTLCQVAAGLQHLPVRGIRLGGSCGFTMFILTVLDPNSPPCLLPSGEGGDVPAAPKSSPAAAPGQQHQQQANMHQLCCRG